MKLDFLNFALNSLSSIERGIVVEILESGEFLVEVKDGPHRLIHCDFLETSDQTLIFLRPGDSVLFLLPKTSEEKGCVLGRIGRYKNQKKELDKKIPENLVFEAKERLDLRCGSSSIIMQQNGKLIVKAVDVVSRAKRNNKIKGGTVNIN